MSAPGAEAGAGPLSSRPLNDESIMSERTTTGRGRRLRRGVVMGLCLGVLAGVGPARAAEKASREEPRVAVGKSLAPAGTLLERTAPGKPWRIVVPKGEVSSGDLLLAMPLSRAVVEAKDGAAQLLFWGNLPQVSPFPILESAVVLHPAKNASLDFTPQRGRVVVSNQKRKEPVRVRVRLPDEVWSLTLVDPETEVALETYGRWPRGVPFSADPKSADAPTLDVSLLVLKGSAELDTGRRKLGLSAPPGPAFFHWDSVAGDDPGPSRLEKLPSWLGKGLLETPEARMALDALKGIAKRYQAGEAPETVVGEMMKEADKEGDKARAGVMRRGAVYGMAALDLLGGLIDALASPHADARETAVTALRGWIGRGPGQDLKLYDFLQKDEHYTPNQAATLLQLLHSYGSSDLDNPETYETLIAYLRHKNPAIRELAIWHLDRLVPAGKKIPYDPTAPAEERDKAHQEWKKLVPSGQLPRPEKGGK
jgi:hypothetical protein